VKTLLLRRGCRWLLASAFSVVASACVFGPPRAPANDMPHCSVGPDLPCFTNWVCVVDANAACQRCQCAPPSYVPPNVERPGTMASHEPNGGAGPGR